MYKCRKWEIEHYNSVSEITVSFMGIHKWEPAFIFTGLSLAVYSYVNHIKTKVNKVSIFANFFIFKAKQTVLIPKL
jgi:hypothetical protein